MGPEMAIKNVRKIEVPTDTPTDFQLGDIATDIPGRRERREQGEREGGSQEGENSTVPDRGGSGQKRPRAERIESVKVKWTQRVKERPVHLLNIYSGAKRTYDGHLFKRLR